MQAKVNSNLMSDTLTEAGLLFYMHLCQVRQLSEYNLTSTSDYGNLTSTGDRGDKITLVFLGKQLISTKLQKWQHLRVSLQITLSLGYMNTQHMPKQPPQKASWGESDKTAQEQRHAQFKQESLEPRVALIRAPNHMPAIQLLIRARVKSC